MPEEQKSELRARLRDARTRRTDADRVEAGRRIAFSVEPYVAQAQVIAAFAASPRLGEPDLDALIATLLERGKIVALPRTTSGGLVLHRIDRLTQLAPMRLRFREPDPSRPVVAVEDLDLVLVPGLAFTARGERLGHGGGYYDRLLAAPGLRAKTVGICFADEVLPSLPLVPHDRPVMHVVSD